MTMYYTKSETHSNKTGYDWGLRKYLVSIYQNMALALTLTAVVAMGAAGSQEFMYIIHGTGLKWVVAFAPIVMTFYISSKIMSMSQTGAQTCLMVFASLMGLSLSSIFIVFTGESIARVFFITAGTFGAMSMYGQTTKKDLSSIESFLMMGVIGLTIAGATNIFLRSTAITFISSIVGVIVFTLFTAYDSQKIKSLYYQTYQNTEVSQKLSIYAVLMLYMDFVNLFIFLLQILGVRKND